jgi:hypothetical protein
MSKSKNDNDIRYTREKLLASKALSGYQKDFAAVILTNETYTLSEAKAALDAALNKTKH